MSLKDLSDLVAKPLPNVRSKAPSENVLFSTMQRRYKQDAPYTLCGDSGLVIVNPNRLLSDVNDASAEAYIRQSQSGEPEELEPSPYDLACRAFSLMRGTGRSQAIVYHGISGSGKSYASRMITNQLLRIAASGGKRETKLGEQIRALQTILQSFGHAGSQSRFASFLELHFTSPERDSKLAAAKVLTFALDKSRVTRQDGSSRCFNVLYEMLAGASPNERQDFGLNSETSDYLLINGSSPTASSADPSEQGAQRMAFEDLKAALDCLGFKRRHITGIFKVLSAILLLGNLTFAGHEVPLSDDVSWVETDARPALEVAAALLGLAAEELENSLVNRTKWVKKERLAIILAPAECLVQRDLLTSSLYAVLFAYIVECANSKVFPGEAEIAKVQQAGGSSIVQLDLPGFQTRQPQSNEARRSTLLQTIASDRYSEFAANFSQDIVQYWLSQRLLDDTSSDNARMTQDGLNFQPIEFIDRSIGRLELLRGGVLGDGSDSAPGGIIGGLAKHGVNVRKGKAGEENPDSAFLRQMRQTCKTSTSFIAFPLGQEHSSSFGVHHWSGPVTYDANAFVSSDMDIVDSDFVGLLKESEDSFVSRLLAGPSLATEVHPRDRNVITAAQVSSQPLRQPSPLVGPSRSSREDAPLPSLDLTPYTSQINTTLTSYLELLNKPKLWTVFCIAPNGSAQPSSSLDERFVRGQIRSLLPPEILTAQKESYVADVSHERFSKICEKEGADVQQLCENEGWTAGPDYFIGNTRVWLSYRAWKQISIRYIEARGHSASRAPTPFNMLSAPSEEQQAKIEAARAAAQHIRTQSRMNLDDGDSDGSDIDEKGGQSPADFGKGDYEMPYEQEQISTARLSYDHDAQAAYRNSTSTNLYEDNNTYGEHPNPSQFTINPLHSPSQGYFGESQYTLGNKELDVHDTWGDEKMEAKQNEMTRKPTLRGKPATVEVAPISGKRRFWLALVWFVTWWIPDFMLRKVGRMKRPDVRLAWREKVTLCALIALLCAFVVFYIVAFGLILCPEYNRVWNAKELGYHQGEDDYWVGVRGSVYDLTDFWRIQHSDIQGLPVTDEDMLSLAGQDITNYFPIPLNVACPSRVTNENLFLSYATWTPLVSTALHTSGVLQPDRSSALAQADWYESDFLPVMKKYRKGPLVYSRGNVTKEAKEGEVPRQWAIYNDRVYDLSDYFATLDANPAVPDYAFLDSAITNLWQARAGTDVTSALDELDLNEQDKQQTLGCMRTLFDVGQADPRETPRCEVQPYMLLGFAAILVAVIGIKFLAALQFGTKRLPEKQDKFVICQVPCYTESEESLKKTLDSLAVLDYDDRRKLMFIICDGTIVGAGNDRSTPRIVLDILGVSEASIDPDPLIFKSLGDGARQINYAKVYSGLYEHEGHVVPFVVVVKVGKPSERSKPGNRGKRDSQVLLLRFLNRVHLDTEMSPLELEIYHQLKNVIGVDPLLYDYLLTVDADTEVHTDSLTRLVAQAQHDAKIIGICGETKLANEKQSITTMIQVYEYYISHHLSKAFESLFGSVTCLPGCFTMYRIKSADKGKPLVVSNAVLDAYAENNVDTLHKKNLLSLGEDRFFSTLLLQHFPTYKTKFTQDAVATTAAPERWSILLSQRRRWINSTVHNLVELLSIKDLCGTCCFSMRFIVFIDLLGTLILPATTVYLVYLIVIVSSGNAQVPIFSLVMLGAVYGLQVVIFLLKREWQFIGWLIIYLLAFPIYSFFLPLYSFWHFDDFSWGQTRVVIGEGKNKKVLAAADDDYFDDSMIPLSRFSDYQSQAWREEAGMPNQEKPYPGPAPSISGFSMVKPPQSLHLHKNSFAGSSRTSPASTPGGLNYQQNFPSSISQVPSPMYGHRTVGSTQQGYGFPTAPSMMGSIHGGQSEMGRPPTSLYGFAAPTNLNLQSAFSSQLGLSMMGGESVMGSQMGMPAPKTNYSNNPSDNELVDTIKAYLANQDLMTVTKRTTRQAMTDLFPNADLKPRKEFLNNLIDQYCTGQL